jgi:hypothetical protein
MLSSRFLPAVWCVVSLPVSISVLAFGAHAAPIKVACIGEHTTHSHAFPADNREAQPPGMQEYPARLQALLGADYEVRNFGDCCGTVLQGYTPQPGETHPYVNGTNPNDGVGYNESIVFLPDIVIIGSWGRHDWGLAKAPGQVFTLQGFQAGYEDLVKRYQALSSHPKIFVSLPIPILNGQGDVPDGGVKTSDVLPVVMAVADKYQLPLVDLYHPFLNHMELFKQPPDPKDEGEGEHVNDAGIGTIASAVFTAMQLERNGSGGAAGMGGAAAGSAGTSAGGAFGGGAAGAAGTVANVGGTESNSSAGASATAGTVAFGGAGAPNPPSAGGQTAGAVATAEAGTHSALSAAPSGEAGCGCHLHAEHRPGYGLWLLGALALTTQCRRRRRERLNRLSTVCLGISLASPM